MSNKLLCAAAAAALSMGGAQAYAAVITIDTFDTDQRVEDLANDDPRANQVDAPEAIGDYRELLVETFGGAEEDTELEVQSGEIAFNNDTGAFGQGWITYDGSHVGDPFDEDDVDVTGLGVSGVDLWDGPGGAFLFDVIEADASIFIEIMAWDVDGNSVSFSETIVEGGGSPAVAFSLFDGDDGFDWNQVGALRFSAASGGEPLQPSLDGSISAISVDTGVIPLPASAFLLLGGLGGLTAFRARRKKA